MAADRDNYGKLSLTYSWTFVSQPSGHCPQAHIACVEDFCNNQNYFTDGDYSLGLVFRASALLVAPENVCAPTVYPVIRDKSKPTTVGCTPVGPPASGRNAAARHGLRFVACCALLSDACCVAAEPVHCGQPVPAVPVRGGLPHAVLRRQLGVLHAEEVGDLSDPLEGPERILVARTTWRLTGDPGVAVPPPRPHRYRE